MAVTVGNIKTVDFSSTWEIKNFSSTPKIVGTFIWSPRFKIKNTEWILKLYPYGKSVQTNNFVSLFLMSTTCFETQINDNVEIGVSFKFSILNRLKEKVMSEFKNCLFTKKDSSFGFDKYISKDILLNGKDLYLFEDKFMILCEIYINPQVDRKFVLYNNTIMGMSEDFESLFLEQSFTDLTIIVNNKKLFVHKSILSARSKVFRAMLEHDMKENKENLVEITDTSYDVMKEVLRFIYSGKIENLEKLAFSILPVADKYDLGLLKSICEDVIWKSLNIENACETLAVAETHNCNDLKSRIIKYIITNIKKVTLTSGFEELKNSKSPLLGDILYKIAQEYSIS